MSEPRRWISPAYLLVALALTFLMPSSDSLWIDEAQTWKFAVIPDFPTWFRALCTNPFSEALMPLGMFFAWISAKLVGTSEWQLRAINILWTALGVIAFWRIGKALRAPWAPLLFAVQPFVWFYANEARPYSLQIACGAWLLAGLVVAIEQRRFSRGPLLMAASAGLILVGSSLFGIVTLAAFIAVVVALWSRNRLSLSRDWTWIAIVLFCGCIFFGIYYFGALNRGAMGARLWSVGVANLAFSIYEFVGFAGLGPPRDELRELAQTVGTWGVLRNFLAYAAGLLVLGVLVGTCLSRPFRANHDGADQDFAFSTGAATVLIWVATVTLATVAHFPFWGRHLAPSFPFYAGLLAAAAAPRRSSSTHASPPLICALALVLLASSLRLRFATEYRKDDYRGAVRLARDAAASGKLVWWVADPNAAIYYGLNFSDPNTAAGGVVLWPAASGSEAAVHAAPHLIVLSKPDVYDERHVVRDFISASGYAGSGVLKSFTLFRKNPLSHVAPLDTRPTER